jgi:hypothetical protein
VESFTSFYINFAGNLNGKLLEIENSLARDGTNRRL